MRRIAAAILASTLIAFPVALASPAIAAPTSCPAAGCTIAEFQNVKTVTTEWSRRGTNDERRAYTEYVFMRPVLKANPAAASLNSERYLNWQDVVGAKASDKLWVSSRSISGVGDIHIFWRRAGNTITILDAWLRTA